ncbi:unnamed protein product, partial [Prorocentrum cordatum]
AGDARRTYREIHESDYTMNQQQVIEWILMRDLSYLFQHHPHHLLAVRQQQQIEDGYNEQTYRDGVVELAVQRNHKHKLE